MNSNEPGSSQYTVVARRYRPQAFGDMVGQNHIAHALTNAIKQNRVGHAYLFTGARGVGKTSSARIFAKCLNCEQGPTGQPCNQCDICSTVSVGEDIDVLEIDGASNRGIDEIRQLRSNAIVRPSRARFKIYIIDEVHMLTQQAFNALLKTLEEPPGHVKFIFCTTDPQKIPITVLSRCQRFDFSPVQMPDIVKRLQEICENEGIQAEEQALSILARRASGSMRDSQSLLEQLLSFCAKEITVADVHQLLGTAGTGRIAEIVEAIIGKQAAECLNAATNAIQSGVDAGQLARQLLGYFRDIMAIRVGANPETLLMCDESDITSFKKQANELGLETTLAIVQVLDRCITRMQSSLHSRTLLEVALIRICNLERLDLIADLADQLGHSEPADSGSAPASISKKNEVARRDERHHDQTQPTADSVASKVGLTSSNAVDVWKQAATKAGGMLTDAAIQFKDLRYHNDGLTVTFAQKHLYEFCVRSDRIRALEHAIEQLTGKTTKLTVRLDEVSQQPQEPKTPRMTRVQRIRQLEQHELVKRAIEVFDAEVVDFRDPPGS